MLFDFYYKILLHKWLQSKVSSLFDCALFHSLFLFAHAICRSSGVTKSLAITTIRENSLNSITIYDNCFKIKNINLQYERNQNNQILLYCFLVINNHWLYSCFLLYGYAHIILMGMQYIYIRILSLISI